MAQIEAIPGSVVLYVQGGSLRSVPRRSLFEYPAMQHIYDPGVGESELGMYLIGHSPVPSADGRWLVITDPLPSGPDIQPGTTWLGDLLTGELISLGRPALAPTWSPDGYRMAYVLDETLYVRDVAGYNEPVAIFRREGLQHLYARWSPTGEWIAVADDAKTEDRTSPTGLWTYWLVSPDGSEVRELGTWTVGGMGAAPQNLDWSPDGKLLLALPSYVVLTLEGQSLDIPELYEHPPDSVPAHLLPAHLGRDKMLDKKRAWLSHDGQQIAYLGHDGIYVFDRGARTDSLIATYDTVDPTGHRWSTQVRWSVDDRLLLVGILGTARSEDGVPWGRILALEPEAGNVPELLVEGEEVYLVDAIPDAARTGVKATSGAEVSDAIYGGIRFSFDPTLAAGVLAESIPATALRPGWTVGRHVSLSLNGYVLPETLHAPRILVYPVAEFEAVNGHVAKTIADLRQLLVDRPEAPEAIPVLPSFHAGQMMRAGVAYLRFREGTGVRFLTQYAQAYLPINNHELFYTFQGLTDDGRAYVAAILPVSHPGLPPNQAAYQGNLDALVRGFDTYIEEVEEQLNEGDPSSYTPNLSLLDAMMRSLEVGPAWPAGVLPVIDSEDDPYPDWESYINEDYGFTLRYPGTWTLREETGFVGLRGDTLRLAIVYRRQGEAYSAHWSGMPAGDYQDLDPVPALGLEIGKQALVYEGKVKVLVYSGEAGDLVFSARLDDLGTMDYQTIEIPESAEDQADRILGSLETW